MRPMLPRTHRSALVVLLISAAIACGSNDDALPNVAPGADRTADDAGDGTRTPGDGGSSESTPDAAREGTDAGDAGTTPGACGAGRCRGAETCVNGACVQPACVGAQVPGDYATVLSAVTALQNVGGTICIGEGTFDELISLTGAKSIVLQGVSAAKTTVRAFSIGGALTGDGFTIRGLSTTASSDFNVSGKLTIEDCVFTANGDAVSAISGVSHTPTITIARTKITSQSGVALKIGSYASVVTAVLDGLDLNGTTGLEYLPNYGNQGTGAGGHLTLQNSWVHDCEGNGVSGSLLAGSILILLNNTITGNAVGVSNNQPPSATRFSWANNIVANNTLGASLTGIDGFNLNNAFFGNQTNYDGTAADGTAYVKSDCSLVPGTAPPALGPSSPCRGAGAATAGTGHDYWGVARPASVSIGAVE